ncbi:helix-turn-helix domain-containing protein [Bacillus toyonensis]|uniref:helix-turn-helix domain-containing protein n=1 Tax=Bacillus toyonensis TaxID=155322 RepID=UPI000BED442F|nr:helix-turn-helix transcriptional regulator [Bacillus toyonensis]MED2709035.1 helix-turn-helix transcriptional regulator [Bacillus toyonensis]MED2742348.1 helix-turn-helix transcriptional regulator [Bacillus toyonensis]PDZ26810.1 transcriptional regulator [Bacillus toyonensis]PEB17044.1 transcriptional regulator [Bacillus toyonensis]PEK45375.1 transcriptional regulator [Bacillus toyonensis]
MKISKSILDYRKRNNFSQEQLANKIGVTRQAISKWEQEKGTPDIENLILLSGEMNISLDNLIKGNSNIKERIMNNEKAIKFHLLVILFLVAIIIYIAYFALIHKIFMVGFLIATLFMLGIESYVYMKNIRIKNDL